MKKYFYTLLLILCTLGFFACNGTSLYSNTKKPEIENQGVRIDYTDTEKGDTTLLFVHGWCINKTYWSDQVSYFKRSYRVVTIDLPGFGQSGKNQKKWDVNAFGKDVSAVIQQLKLKNVILVGHSMAGDIIVQAAINTPEQVIGLVGVDNFKNLRIDSKLTKKDSEDYKKAVDSLRHDFKRIAFDYFKHDLFYKTTSKAIRVRILNDVAHADPNIAADCMELSNFDEFVALTRTKKKLCLINSDVKPTVITGFKAKGIPFQIWYIHDTGHFPMVEKPQEFNALLSDAIRKINYL